MIVTRSGAGAEWTSVDTTLTMDDDTGGATLSAMPSGLTTITAAAIQATYDAVQAEYGHLLPRDTLTPPTGGPSVPAAALLALLLGATALLATGWVLTAAPQRRVGPNSRIRSSRRRPNRLRNAQPRPGRPHRAPRPLLPQDDPSKYPSFPASAIRHSREGLSP